jgi:hypothetical protein
MDVKKRNKLGWQRIEAGINKIVIETVPLYRQTERKKN